MDAITKALLEYTSAKASADAALASSESLADSKVNSLTNAAESKLALLSGTAQQKLANTGIANLEDSSAVIDGISYHNKNKVWNDRSKEQMYDFYYNYLPSQALEKGDDGRYYKKDDNGNLVAYEGPTRRLYEFGTKTSPDEVKFGLARGDIDGSEERYQGNWFTRLFDNYGWDSGPEGVDVNKKRRDLVLPYNLATVAEGIIHGNTNAIENRAWLSNDPEGYARRGSGSTEYYKNKESIFGTGPGTGEAFPVDAVTQLSNELNERRAVEHANRGSGGYESRAGEFVDMFQASLVNEGTKIARLAGSVTDLDEKAAKLLGVESQYKEITDKIASYADPETGMRKSQEYTGVSKFTLDSFDRDQKNGDKAFEKGVEAYKKGNYADATLNVLESIYLGAKNIDRHIAQSLGAMGELMIPFVGMPLYAANRTQDQMIEYSKNNDGKVMDPEDVAKNFGINLALAVPERILLAMGIKNVLPGKGGSLRKVGTSTLGETFQEYGEGVQETYAGQREGERTLGEVMSDPSQIYQGVVGGIVGGGLAATTAAPAAVINKVGQVGKNIVGTGKLENDSAYLTKQQEKGGLLHPDNLANVNDVKSFKNVVDELNKNTSSGMVENALVHETIMRKYEAAQKSGDPEAINAANQLIVDLHNSDDIDFNIFHSIKQKVVGVKNTLDTILTQEVQNKKKFDLAKQKGSTEEYVPDTKTVDTIKALEQELAGYNTTLEALSNNDEIKGSDEFGPPIDERIKAQLQRMQDYFDGKDIESVADEVIFKGITEFDDEGNEVATTKHGINTWVNNFTDELDDPKTRNNLLNEKRKASIKGTLSKLREQFLETRYSKLFAKGENVFNAISLLSAMSEENEHALSKMKELRAKVDSVAANLRDGVAESYYKEIDSTIATLGSANKEIARRKAVVEAAEKEAKAKGYIGKNSHLTFEVSNKNNKTLTIWNKKKGKSDVVYDVVENTDGSYGFKESPNVDYGSMRRKPQTTKEQTEEEASTDTEETVDEDTSTSNVFEKDEAIAFIVQLLQYSVDNNIVFTKEQVRKKLSIRVPNTNIDTLVDNIYNLYTAKLKEYRNREQQPENETNVYSSTDENTDTEQTDVEKKEAEISSSTENSGEQTTSEEKETEPETEEDVTEKPEDKKSKKVPDTVVEKLDTLSESIDVLVENSKNYNGRQRYRAFRQKFEEILRSRGYDKAIPQNKTLQKVLDTAATTQTQANKRILFAEAAHIAITYANSIKPEDKKQSRAQEVKADAEVGMDGDEDAAKARGRDASGRFKKKAENAEKKKYEKATAEDIAAEEAHLSGEMEVTDWSFFFEDTTTAEEQSTDTFTEEKEVKQKPRKKKTYEKSPINGNDINPYRTAKEGEINEYRAELDKGIFRDKKESSTEKETVPPAGGPFAAVRAKAMELSKELGTLLEEVDDVMLKPALLNKKKAIKRELRKAKEALDKKAEELVIASPTTQGRITRTIMLILNKIEKELEDLYKYFAGYKEYSDKTISMIDELITDISKIENDYKKEARAKYYNGIITDEIIDSLTDVGNKIPGLKKYMNRIINNLKCR